jgi:MbtH protein
VAPVRILQTLIGIRFLRSFALKRYDSHSRNHANHIAQLLNAIFQEEDLIVADTGESRNETVYKVLVNEEKQYSLWRADKDIPAGWKDEGTSGSKEECLAHIEEVWIDMRPLSLRKRMQSQTSKA